MYISVIKGCAIAATALVASVSTGNTLPISEQGVSAQMAATTTNTPTSDGEDGVEGDAPEELLLARYPGEQILDWGNSPLAGRIPIRRGFYDSKTNKGFAYDKIRWKHAIPSMQAIKNAMGTPNGGPQYDKIVGYLYAGRSKCDWWHCYVTDQRKLRVVMDVNWEKAYYGFPIKGIPGLVTLYCENPDRANECPNWVDSSLQNHLRRDEIVLPDENSLGTGTETLDVMSYDPLPRDIPVRRVSIGDLMRKDS